MYREILLGGNDGKYAFRITFWGLFLYFQAEGLINREGTIASSTTWLEENLQDPIIIYYILPDNRRSELFVENLRILVNLPDDWEGESVGPRLQRTQLLAQQTRQHRNHAMHHVHASCTLRRYLKVGSWSCYFEEVCVKNLVTKCWGTQGTRNHVFVVVSIIRLFDIYVTVKSWTTTGSKITIAITNLV